MLNFVKKNEILTFEAKISVSGIFIPLPFRPRHGVSNTIYTIYITFN